MATCETTVTYDAPHVDVTDVVAGPKMPEPFEVEFDFEHDWCSRAVEDVTYDLVAEARVLDPALGQLLARELVGLDQYDAEQLLKGYVTDLEEMVDDEELDDTDEIADLSDMLGLAAASLTYCEHSCCCALDAYESWGRDMLDEALDDLGDHVWAVFQPRSWVPEPADFEDDIDDVLTTEALFNVVNSRDGWTCCSLKWDGSMLTASFTVYRAGTSTLELVPLTEEQKDLWRFWGENTDYPDSVAAAVVRADPSALDKAREVWNDTEAPDEVYETFEALLDAVTAVGADQLVDLDVDITARLAPTWTADVASLLATSLNLTAAPAPVSAYAA